MSALERIWYPSGPLSTGEQAAAAPLALAEQVFRGGVAVRRALYERGLLPTHHVHGVRVICVGNLTVGGAGKTPTVIHLANRLLARGEAVAVVSRGYGRRGGGQLQLQRESRAEEVGDEPLLIARRVPGASVWVGADRAAAVQRARDAGARVVLLDDGFQHRRLSRDVDLVVVDGAVGLGNGHLLPRGPLREPPSALERAHAIWLRTDDPAALPPPEARQLPLIRAQHHPASLRLPDGQPAGVEALRGQRVLAFAGLARPAGFLRSLQALGADVRGHAFFPDHHPFTDRELASLQAQARAERAMLVTTEKDEARLAPGHGSAVLVQDVRILTGEDVLLRLVG